MAESTLKLIVEKGPREGETLDCRPRSVIRIGRVVKGNTFTIKDDGISSKHLAIEFKEGKWVVSDLDSSNGTLLNKVKLQALIDFDLRDGDVIKIGECTSLKVNIEKETKEVKNSRKMGKNSSVDVEVAKEIDAENEENQLRRNPRRVVASKGTRASKHKPSESISISVAENRTRRGRTRASKDVVGESVLVPVAVQKIPESLNFEQESLNAVAENQTQRGTSKDEPVESVSASLVVQKKIETLNKDHEICREYENVAPIKGRRTRRAALVAVSKKNNESLDSVSEIPKIPESLNFNQECNVAPVEEQTRKNRIRASQEAESSKFVPISVSEEPLVPKQSNLQKESSDVKGNLVPTNATKVDNGIDLEKMTLAEWFDYLEVYLPKQINEVTEEIISKMRERSKQFNEFMLQQKDLKATHGFKTHPRLRSITRVVSVSSMDETDGQVNFFERDVSNISENSSETTRDLA